MTLLIIENLFSLIQVSIVAVYYYKVLGTKNKFILPSLILATFAMPFISNLFPISPMIRVLAIHTLHIIFLLLFFNGKVSKKLATFAAYFLLSFACDFLVFTLTGAMGIQNETIFTLVMNFMMIVLLSLLLTVVANYIDNFSKIYDKKIYLAFILIPVTQFGFISLSISLMNSIGIIADSYKGISSQNVAIIVSALLIFTLIADIVFLKVTYSASENFRNKEKLQSLEEQAKLNYKYYEELQTNTDKMRKYRHDTNNIIQSIYSILENPDDNSTEQAMELTKTLEDEINSINLNRYCSHTIVNAVLADKENMLAKVNAKCRFSVNIPQDISISGFDLCRVFSNILDNAYEACSDLSDSKITLDASIIDGYLYIKLCNPFEKKEKPTDSERGNGLEIIKQITDKYNGETIVTVENGIFETLVTLKCE